MANVLRIWATFVLALNRLYAQGGLALASLLGVTSAAVLVVIIPVYVDAIDCRLLREELSGNRIGHDRPPSASYFHYFGSIHGPITLDELRPSNCYLSGPIFPERGLSQ